MFGNFYCTGCQHKWSSGNAWEGKGQECLLCREMVLPVSLRPLRPRFRREEDRKPHLEDLCQKCQELGYNCRGYADEPDDVSVISESSSVSDSSVSEQDLDEEDLTPVPSDSELTEELLDHLETLNLDKK